MNQRKCTGKIINFNGGTNGRSDYEATGILRSGGISFFKVTGGRS